MKRKSYVHIACFAFSCITIVSSLSNRIRAGNQQCLPEESLLFSNLGCSVIGEADIVFIAKKAVPPVLVNTQSEHKPTPDLTTWSLKPVCTDFVGENSNQLCVYTNATFGNGRGISIFTTPEIATHFIALPALRDPTILTEVNKATGPWYTRSFPGKGIGMLARQSLKRGDLITAYTPILLVYMENTLSTKEREKYLRVAIEQLPQKSKDKYFNLATIYGYAETIVQDVLKANTFEVQIGSHRHMAIFPETSRMNHDCGPNSQYHLSPTTLVHTVHAARTIPADTEITISYINPTEPHSVRRAQLQNAFHFTCQCSRCLAGTKSDSNLQEIIRIQKILGNWSADSKPKTKLVEKLLELYESEGLHSFMDTAYGYAALTWSGAGDWDATINFAKLAAEAVELKDGQKAKDFAMWQEMERDPSKHWSWRRSRL